MTCWIGRSRAHNHDALSQAGSSSRQVANLKFSGEWLVAALLWLLSCHFSRTLVLKLAFGFEQLQVAKGAGMAMHSRQGGAV